MVNVSGSGADGVKSHEREKGQPHSPLGSAALPKGDRGSVPPAPSASRAQKKPRSSPQRRKPQGSVSAELSLLTSALDPVKVLSSERTSVRSQVLRYSAEVTRRMEECAIPRAERTDAGRVLRTVPERFDMRWREGVRQSFLGSQVMRALTDVAQRHTAQLGTALTCVLGAESPSVTPLIAVFEQQMIRRQLLEVIEPSPLTANLDLRMFDPKSAERGALPSLPPLSRSDAVPPEKQDTVLAVMRQEGMELYRSADRVLRSMPGRPSCHKIMQDPFMQRITLQSGAWLEFGRIREADGREQYGLAVVSPLHCHARASLSFPIEPGAREAELSARLGELFGTLDVAQGGEGALERFASKLLSLTSSVSGSSLRFEQPPATPDSALDRAVLQEGFGNGKERLLTSMLSQSTSLPFPLGIGNALRGDPSSFERIVLTISPKEFVLQAHSSLENGSPMIDGSGMLLTVVIHNRVGGFELASDLATALKVTGGKTTGRACEDLIRAALACPIRNLSGLTLPSRSELNFAPGARISRVNLTGKQLSIRAEGTPNQPISMIKVTSDSRCELDLSLTHVALSDCSFRGLTRFSVDSCSSRRGFYPRLHRSSEECWGRYNNTIDGTFSATLWQRISALFGGAREVRFRPRPRTMPEVFIPGETESA